MNRSLALLEKGFMSSSIKTQQFKSFCRVFKTEFSWELKSIGATKIFFYFGHFYISGFFTFNNQAYYFNLPDVRNFEYGLANDPESCMNKLLYREVIDYKDYTGGKNRYVKIELDMSAKMCNYFK